jgi:type I restriction enzyme M protein
MDLAICGSYGQIAHGDSFHHDRFPNLKADVILATPLLNVNGDWSKGLWGVVIGGTGLEEHI